jgi:hypothetical protein
MSRDFSSVIIDNFNIFGFIIAPLETNPILVVYANAVLTRTITGQFFQMIAGRNSQVVQIFGRIQKVQSAPRAGLYVGGKFSGHNAIIYFFGFLTLE